MKKIANLIFAGMIAVTLSMPAWSQSTTGTNNQAKAVQKDSKEDRKEARKDRKEDRREARKDRKEDRKEARKAAKKK